MKTFFAFCAVVLCFTFVNAQDTKAHNEYDGVVTTPQQQPKFPGDINKYLADNIVYPKDAEKNNIEGTVYTSFVVEKDGSVSGVKVMRGVAASLDNESVRVVSAMPKWTPGMQNGHTVRAQYMVPIHYMLTDNKAPEEKKN